MEHNPDGESTGCRKPTRGNYGPPMIKRLRWAYPLISLTILSTVAVAWWLLKRGQIEGALLYIPAALSVLTGGVISWYGRHLDDEI